MSLSNNISITGKQTKVGNSLSEYVTKTLTTTLKKYFKKFIGSNVIFSKDRFNFKCEISVHIEGSIFVKGNSFSNDAYEAFNISNEKIKKRLRRYHRKIIDHRSKNSNSIKFLEANEYIIKDPEKNGSDKTSDQPVIISESEEIIKTISVSEAIMLMNLNDQNAIFFKNIQSNRLNILFRRTDGNIGWLDPKKKI